MTFSEIYNKRKKLHDALLENESGLLEIVQDLYSDITHFIYEILQNAEDAKASSISFILSSNKLEIYHNGSEFTIDDIDGITNVAGKRNEKKTNKEKIGKFGIGFKSVYAVTNLPKIQSGQFEFEIKNYLLPINFTDNKVFTETIISLPFNKEDRSEEEIFELIKNKFESFEFYNLLFLTHLNSVTLQWDEYKKQFNKNEKLIKGCDSVYDLTISVGKDKHEYLLFRSDVQHTAFAALKNKPKNAIAFKKGIIDKQEEIIKADSSNLFAFFETGYETFLNFLLQAPFSTTPARDNIDFKLKINLALLDELCDLMKNALEHFRKNKLINVNFLNQLPISTDIDESKLVYQKLFEAVKTELASDKKYLPSMFKNQYHAAEDLAIVRGRELTSVISSPKDLQMLFGVKYWMDTKITVDRTPKLLEYLTNVLEIGEYTPDDFARKITEEFLLSKPDKWVQRFYEFLNGKQESLWRSGRGKDEGVLRRKPIIRLINGEHTQPFDTEGKPKVFLQISKQQIKYETVNPKVIDSKASLDFIKNKLGIKEPNLFDEIKHHILPLYKDETTSPNKTEHIKHCKLILEVYLAANDTTKEDLVNLFSDIDVKFIQSINAKTGESTFQNYQFVYLPSALLKRYFRFSENIYFLNTEYYSTLSQEQFLQFLKHCGVKDYAWRIDNDPKFSEEKLSQLRKEGNYGDSRKVYWDKEKVSDHKLEGLEDILSQEKYDKEDSLLIWAVLLNCLRADSNHAQFFRGEYTWHYGSVRQVYFKNTLLKKLQDSKWLFRKNEKISAQIPSEILLSELAEEYEQNSEEARFLIDHLKFKTEAEQLLIGQMPADRQEMFNQFDAAKKLCDEKGIDLISALTELMTAANREEEKKQIENAPELSSVEPEEETFESFDDSNVDADVIDDDDSSEGENDSDKRKPKTPSQKETPMSQEMRNKIGQRGEIIVFSFLKSKWNKKATLISETESEMIYQDKEGHKFTISILNADGKKGIGCDILIKNEETVYEYIEVKSSKLIKKDLFPVNGYQWTLALKVFKQGEGNKYFFYIVKDVLSDKPKVTPIKNPIKKWKDGELRAHPVNLEL